MQNSIHTEALYLEPYQRFKMQFLATITKTTKQFQRRLQNGVKHLKMKLFEKNIFNRPLFQPFTVYEKSSILDVPLYSEYASGTINYFCNRLQDVWLGSRYTFGMFKACVRYFLRNFYLSPNGSPSKTMKDVFYFILKALFVLDIFKFLYFHLAFIFSLSASAWELDLR